MTDSKAQRGGPIRVGVGGWTYPPWRDNFYPAGWPQSRELEYASRKLTAIEINGTYYSLQKPASFAKWCDETPEGFVFSLKASRYCTHRRVLGEAREGMRRFFESGMSELGPKLGPIVWQFATTKRFEPDDFEAFLALLPKSIDGLALRHVMEVRHASFMTSKYLALARRYGVATVFTDSDEYPSFADPSGELVYARLMRADAEHADGYAGDALDAVAACARQWSRGEEPANLPRIEAAPRGNAAKPREVFVFFINGAKEKAPAAAQALIARLG